jgi:hypothetical protein
MTENLKPSESVTLAAIDDKDLQSRKENAIVGYQVAIDLWKNQENQGWSRFNLMLVVNGIIIAAIGLSGDQNSHAFFSKLLPIAGLLISIVWFFFLRREVAWSTYYALSARELEEKYLSDPVKTVSRGGRFQRGESVTIDIGDKPFELRMGRLGRIIREKAAADWIIAILAVLYVATIIQNLL